MQKSPNYVNKKISEVFLNIPSLVSLKAPTFPRNNKKNLSNLLWFYTLLDGILYEQVEGVAMGSPLGPLLANTFMCSIEEKLEERNELPSFYKRYVDDTFTIMPDLNKANAFLDKLSSCHENLNFTMETAE